MAQELLDPNIPRRRENDSVKAKALYFAIIAGAATALVLGALFLYWEFKPYKIFEIESDITILTPNVRVGDNVTYEYTYSKNYPIYSEYTRKLLCDVDGAKKPLQLPIENGGRGSLDTAQHQRVRINVQIPTLTPPKTCRVKTILIYKPNPIREVSYEYETPTFNVLSDNDPAVKDFPKRDPKAPSPSTTEFIQSTKVEEHPAVVVPVPVPAPTPTPNINTNSPATVPEVKCAINLLGIKICN